MSGYFFFPPSDNQKIVHKAPKKAWYFSKTLWFNALVAALAALESVAHVLQPIVPGNVYAYGLVVLTVGNAVLRVITTEGLKL